jgi:hypothetical protein
MPHLICSFHYQVLNIYKANRNSLAHIYTSQKFSTFISNVDFYKLAFSTPNFFPVITPKY